MTPPRSSGIPPSQRDCGVFGVAAADPIAGRRRSDELDPQRQRFGDALEVAVAGEEGGVGLDRGEPG
jgi:hypothetical protein